MDHKARMKDVVSKVSSNRDNLYKTLAAVYEFGLEARSNETEYRKYVDNAYKLNKWGEITASTLRNHFTPAVRIAFNSDDDGVQLDAQPISKYATALSYLESQNVGFKAANVNQGVIIGDELEALVVAKFKDKNVGGIYGAAKFGKTTGDGKGKTKDEKYAEAEATLATKSIGSAFTISPDDIDAEHVSKDGYVVVLAKVDANNKLILVEDLEYDNDAIKSIIRNQFMPKSERGGNARMQSS